MKQKENTSYKHLDLLDGIDLLRADFYAQNFSRHTHEGYAFGVITRGELDFSYQKKSWQAQTGDINLVIPGEIHDGHAKDTTGWSYKMLYLPASFLYKLNQERTEKDTLPFFLPGVVQNPKLSEEFLALYEQLSSDYADTLQKESLLTDWLTAFLECYSADKIKAQPSKKEPLAVKRCQEYLESHLQAQISLDALARLACLSPYHLLRIFRDTVGLPPHLYQQQLRIRKAKELLKRKHPLADIAASLGYTDQSHFSKQFKSITGMTPGCFQKNI